jgi:RNA polymerase sigma-70 factor (ECF subfamily)
MASQKTPKDTPTFEKVIAEHGPFIHKMLSQLGVRAPDLPDVEQEVRLGIVKGLPTFDPELASNPASAMRAWLFGICERQAASQHRRESHRREVLCPERDLPSVRSSAPSAEQSLIEADREALLHALLATLEPRRRAVIAAHELEGIPMDDVAAAMAIPLNTAWNLRRLAREDLRAAWLRRQAQQRRDLVRKDPRPTRARP